MYFFLMYFLIFLSITDNNFAFGTHFRGGIFMLRPRPNGAANEMEIYFTISWRRSSGYNYCDNGIVQNSSLIGYGNNPLSCNGCYEDKVGNMSYQCTDFSSLEDWSFGGKTLYYTFPASTDNITIGYTDCCWVGFSEWNLMTSFSTIPRNDTNVINSTPRATTSPVIRLQEGFNHTIVVPVTDPDGDIVRCRWATETECGSICNAFPGATLDSELCTISYEANQGTGYKAVALAIEDFMTANSSTPLSTVNLQFLVLVFSSNQSHDDIPAFVSPTLMQGVCVAVPPNDTFNAQIVADTRNSTLSISDIVTISPIGTNKGSVNQIGSSNLYYMNISWTPTSVQQGQTNFLCYTAINSVEISSTQICIKLGAGLFPPVLNTTTFSPASEELVFPLSTVWSVEFDRDVQRPTTTAKITFHNAQTKAVVYEIDASSSSEVTYVNSNTMQIKPSFTFPEKQLFYINFENGVAVSLEGCKPGNEPVTSGDFWTFTTRTVAIAVNFTGFAVSSTAIYLTWDVHYVPGIIVIQYYIVECKELETEREWSFYVVEMYAKIISLRPYHSYSCRVQVIDDELMHPFNDPIIVYTHQAAPGGPPQNISIYADLSSNANVTWYPPPVEKHNGVIIYYIIIMTEVETNTDSQFTSSFTHIYLTSLHPYYSYIFKLAAVTIAEGPYSNEHTVLMPEDVPNTGPLSVSFSDATFTSISVHWAPPLPEDHNGIIRYYMFILQEEDGFATFNTSNLFIELTNLRPQYNYNFNISAVTIGPGPSTYGIFRLSNETSGDGNITVYIISSTIVVVDIIFILIIFLLVLLAIAVWRRKKKNARSEKEDGSTVSLTEDNKPQSFWSNQNDYNSMNIKKPKQII